MRRVAAVLCGVVLIPGVLRAQPPSAPSAPPPAAAAAQPDGAKPEPKPTGVAKMLREADGVKPTLRSELARRFVEAVAILKPVEERVVAEKRSIFLEKKTREWVSAEKAAAAGEEGRASFREFKVTPDFYFYTLYGTPLAYSRPLEVLGTAEGPARVGSVSGKRVLDYGYGTAGHLRLLAGLGCDATGVDVDPMLGLLYGNPADRGEVEPAASSEDPKVRGRVKLVMGRWPAEAAAREAVGGGYDLIISKNTLKNGYLHPSQPVDKRLLVDLGVSEEEFLGAMHAALKPGGVVLIYNLSPAPSKEGERYKPWADGRCPFTKEQWEKAGFEVVAFDVKDDEPARRMARALGWDAEGMDVDGDLFGHYTLVRRPK